MCQRTMLLGNLVACLSLLNGNRDDGSRRRFFVVRRYLFTHNVVSKRATRLAGGLPGSRLHLSPPSRENWLDRFVKSDASRFETSPSDR